MIKNKRAKFDYHILDNYTAGIQLHGSEVKSIRNKDVSLNGSFCYFKDNELYLKDMFIKEFKNSPYDNHGERRDRKLLLNKKELRKIKSNIEKKGVSVVPTSVFINERGLIKVNIIIGVGKKNWDKRNSLKDKDFRNELKNYLK